jgi:hypothetical protein
MTPRKFSYIWTGELEKTLFERMCMTQRLKGLVSTCDAMGHRLEPFIDQLGDYLNPTIKGTVFEDLTAVDMQNVSRGEECWLEKDVLQCLGDLLVRKGNLSDAGWVSGGHVQPHAKARQYNKFTQRGAIFSPSSFSDRDSHMVISKGDCQWYAGKIKQIFTYPSGLASKLEAYFVIQRFEELSNQEALQDPYRNYPLVGGRLYRLDLEAKIDVVPSQEITAHFAHTHHDEKDFGFPCFHALPLDKVTLSPHCKLGDTNSFQD